MRAGTLASVLACTLLVVGCGTPSPINDSAASLLLSKSDTGGWPVLMQSVDNSYGSADAARGVVSPGDGTSIDVTVYVFRNASDAQGGYGQARASVKSTAEIAEDLGNTRLGDEAMVAWNVDSAPMVLLWRRDNVVASATGPAGDSEQVVASEEAGKIDRSRR